MLIFPNVSWLRFLRVQSDWSLNLCNSITSNNFIRTIEKKMFPIMLLITFDFEDCSLSPHVIKWTHFYISQSYTIQLFTKYEGNVIGWTFRRKCWPRYDLSYVAQMFCYTLYYRWKYNFKYQPVMSHSALRQDWTNKN